MKKSPEISYRLWQLISNTTHVISKVRQKEFYDYDVSMYHSGILDAISRLGKKSTPVAIAKESSRERHSISEQLSRMERKGLIRKINDLQRKNLIRIELTEKGYESLKRVGERKSIEYVMTALTWDEQRELWSLLARVRDKATEYLGIKNAVFFPPSNIDELLLTDTENHSSL
jgi:DNA-binding MarR family transcriptional regulator